MQLSGFSKALNPFDQGALGALCPVFRCSERRICLGDEGTDVIAFRGLTD
jgi:hypothetical protein